MVITLTLISVGVILIIMGILRQHYSNLFTSADVCRYEALVTDIKDSVQTNGDLVCPYVEYSTDNGTVKAHHYIPVFRSSLNFVRGDTIRILVDPKHPKIFRIADMDLYETDSTRKIPLALVLMGIVSLTAGLIIACI
ncbi:MAG: hypothetical protein GXY08_04750 [Ruminococcus sp.]|nr:hypothetical protein [Ruminococcus sp.]